MGGGSLDPTPRRFAWRAAYFDGRSARRHEVRLIVTPEAIEIGGTDIETLRWPITEVRRGDSGTPGEPIRLEWGGTEPAVLVVDEPQFAAALQRVAPGRFEHSAAPARRLRVGRWLWPAAAVAAVMLVAGYRWGIPALARHVAARVPVSFEESLGRPLVDRLTALIGVCDEPERTAALDAIVARLTADGNGGPYTYRVRVAASRDVNALAAPGGRIVVFHGLLAQAETPEEVAGVLAHEIQHVRLRHGTQAILREVPLRLMAAAITGSGSLGSGVAGTASQLGGLGYRRRDEEEADREGMRMLQAARVAPDGMLAYFARVSATRGDGPEVLNYLSTHPRSADRMAALQTLAAEAAYTAVPVLDAAQWTSLRAPCQRRQALPSGEPVVRSVSGTGTSG